MAKVALVMVPIVLAYTIWSYWVFRKRVTTKVEELKY
jgi:cytochrome d ubiquinol oxidase subunit II